MPVTSDTRNRVVAVPARKERYNIPDEKIKGLAVRIHPNGRKIWFLQVMHEGRRVYLSIGEWPAMSASAAREAARDLLTQIRIDGVVKPAIGSDKNFAHVAEEVFRRHGQRWKPRTRQVNRDYLRVYILPVFGERMIDEITAADVQAWFASLHHKPGAANRRKDDLSV